MSVVNFPYENQRFREECGVYYPFRGGTVIIFTIDWKNWIANIWDRRPLNILPDGRLIRFRLAPFAQYKRTLDGYVYDRNGTITITGRYPDFMTSDGFKVYLDADGMMKFVDPGPIDKRFQLKIKLQREAAAQWRLTPKHLRPGKQKRSDNRSEPLDVSCDQCGGHFEAFSRKRRFCSGACRKKACLDRKRTGFV